MTKFYLRGVGIGIIITAIILSFSKPRISNEEIRTRAKKLGMIMADEEVEKDNITSMLENNSKATDNPEQENINQNQQDEQSKVEEENESKPEPEVESEPDILDENQSFMETENSLEDGEVIDGSDEEIIIYIVKGLDSSEVAAILMRDGIIDDRHAFNEYMVKAGLSEKINKGEHKFKKGLSYEEIGNILTRQK